MGKASILAVGLSGILPAAVVGEPYITPYYTENYHQYLMRLR
jgi:hypothetical protein